MTGPALRLLVVDDHALFREGLTALLAAEPSLEVVGEAGSGREAVRLAEELAPDIILMDLRMPDMNGIEATRRIRESYPAIRIIMLTMVEQDDSLLAALRAGAQSYLLKGADKEAVLETIHAVARGQALFGAAIAERLGDFFQGLSLSHSGSASLEPFPELTEREREVLDLIARGHKNPEIARKLHISPKTVSNHISSIFNKLQVADRVAAIFKAREAGLGGDA